MNLKIHFTKNVAILFLLTATTYFPIAITHLSSTHMCQLQPHRYELYPHIYHLQPNIYKPQPFIYHFQPHISRLQ